MRASLLRLAAESTSARIKNVNDAQRLYMMHPTSPGSVFFLPKGTRIVDKLTAFMRSRMRAHGFQEVITPQLFKNVLWKTSGHWQHYQKDMFKVSGCGHDHHNTDHETHAADKAEETDDAEEEYSLKPMNCPGHCLIFRSQERSFRDLPIRFSDFSPLHRNEASGALSGLTRVRRFHQDDGHIFCRPDQVASEIAKSLELVGEVYSKFGLKFEPRLSTRPEGFIGEIDLWNQAESDLKNVLGPNVVINEGDGAFYGPKIDFIVTDNLQKTHQLATIQLDFQLPLQFGLKYDSAESTKETPVMIHRAVLGSVERFLALLIDHYDGKWPFWINPLQAAVVPVSQAHAEYAQKIASQLQQRNYDIELYAQNEPLGGRIRRAINAAASYVIVVGDREMSSGTVSVRTRESRKLSSLSLDDLEQEFADRVKSFT